MHIYIPTWVFYLPLFYLGIGVLLYVPLVVWGNRFISGKPSLWRAISPKRLFQGIFASAIAWPIILGVSVYTEIDYRKKGYL